MAAPTSPAPHSLPRRDPDGHKGTYGRVLVVAGTRGMSGAAVLTGSAALRGGAGLVQVACPESILFAVSVGNPCYLAAGIAQDADGTYTDLSTAAVVEHARAADVVAIGPGLGNRKDVGQLVWGVLRSVPDKPIVVDADGLNAIAPVAGEFGGRTAPLVLTPHPGEFARLTGGSIADVQADRQGRATSFAKRFKVVVALKGHATLVTDGERTYTNATGNPGMATGGAGDVLTGVIAALIAEGLPAFEATSLGVSAHGRAGDLAAADLSQTALTAADLLNYLPRVFRELEK